MCAHNAAASAEPPAMRASTISRTSAIGHSAVRKARIESRRSSWSGSKSSSMSGEPYRPIEGASASIATRARRSIFSPAVRGNSSTTAIASGSL